jgi:hypothetical protein
MVSTRRGLQGQRGGEHHDEIVNRKSICHQHAARPRVVFDETVRRAAMMQEVPCITTLTGAPPPGGSFADFGRASASGVARTTTQELLPKSRGRADPGATSD